MIFLTAFWDITKDRIVTTFSNCLTASEQSTKCQIQHKTPDKSIFASGYKRNVKQRAVFWTFIEPFWENQ